jgi:hypothetical protein
MRDDRSDPLFVSIGRAGRVVEQGCLSVGDQTPVLHGSSTEVRQSYLVYRVKELKYPLQHLTMG